MHKFIHQILPSTLCLIFVGVFIYLLLATFWPGPYVDYWIDVPMIQSYFLTGKLDLNELVMAHNNVHRILIPRLLFIADIKWFDGTNQLIVAVGLLCKVATAALFIHILQRNQHLPNVWLVALVVISCFHANNIGNIVHSSNIQWDLVSIFSLLSIYTYSQVHLQSTRKQVIVFLLISWLSLVCAFFSHAGALTIPFIFLLIDFLYKKWRFLLINIILLAAILYLSFSVLPVREPHEATYESAVLILIRKFWYVIAYIFKFFSIELGHYLGDFGFYFSVYVLAGILLSLLFIFKTQKNNGNVYLYISLYLLLMILTMAASRVDFSPKTWWAVRYQTTALMLLLSLTLHLYTSLPLVLSRHPRLQKFSSILPTLVLLHTLVMLLIAECFTYKDGFMMSNKAYKAQARMLALGINQRNGAGLLPSLQEYDRIVMAEPLFADFGYAYYANKVDLSRPRFSRYTKPGQRLVADAEIDSFSSQCRLNRGRAQWKTSQRFPSHQFSIALNTEQTGFLRAMLLRNSWYVLDEQGFVQGFGYLFASPQHRYLKAFFKGFLVKPELRYLAEIRNGKPYCLYELID